MILNTACPLALYISELTISLPSVGNVYLIIVFASSRVPISVEQIGPRNGVNVQSQSYVDQRSLHRPPFKHGLL